MSTVDATSDELLSRDDAIPISERGPAPVAVVVGFGFWLFLLSDIVIFAALFAAYAVLSRQTAGGPTGLQLFDRGHVLVAEVRLTHDRLVDHPHPALADGAEGQFGLKWHTKLAHHKNIQRCSQRLGDFEGHRHPAARQPQHDNVLAAQKGQAPCQLTSGVSTILEQPHVLSVSRAVVHR